MESGLDRRKPVSDNYLQTIHWDVRDAIERTDRKQLVKQGTKLSLVLGLLPFEREVFAYRFEEYITDSHPRIAKELENEPRSIFGELEFSLRIAQISDPNLDEQVAVRYMTVIRDASTEFASAFGETASNLPLVRSLIEKHKQIVIWERLNLSTETLDQLDQDINFLKENDRRNNWFYRWWDRIKSKIEGNNI